ncbi:MAG: hypothetical protein QOC98_1360 [Frankiaceae bacterium]|jgi:plastocyanin|nr:hypothetical protein [Frankiaceae bacterium]
MLLPPAVLALALMTGCGSSSTSSAPAAPPAAPSPSASSSGAASAGPVLNIRSFTFDTLTVAPGATLTVNNDDTAPHTVTLATEKIDVKVGAHGTSTLTAPSKPGTYALTCDYHPRMHGTLTVS